MPVSKASVPDIEEMECSEYSNGLPCRRLNGSGVHCAMSTGRLCRVAVAGGHGTLRVHSRYITVVKINCLSTYGIGIYILCKLGIRSHARPKLKHRRAVCATAIGILGSSSKLAQDHLGPLLRRSITDLRGHVSAKSALLFPRKEI